jgi:hypothetical protein
MLGAHPFFGNVPYWAYRGSATKPELLFTATPVRDPRGRTTAYLLGWEDGTTGRLSMAQWERWAPVKAGEALLQGKADRRMCRELDREQIVQVIDFLVERAQMRLGDDLLRWWSVGFHAGAPS